jgi:hypothetical protein
MAKVLRVTRHFTGVHQLVELKRIYGQDVDIVIISETVDAPRVKDLVEEHAPDAVEAVLPLPLVSELLGRNGISVPLIRAAMNREVNEETGEVTFTFDHYEVVKSVEVVVERL